jgi:hypothetical protein
MSDVYNFRITIDLEAGTHEPPKVVRDHLREWAHQKVAEYRARLATGLETADPLDDIGRFNVRTKRLDDYASIDPPLAMRVAAAQCPYSGQRFKDVTINVLPFHCPICSRVVPLDAEGKVRP